MDHPQVLFIGNAGGLWDDLRRCITDEGLTSGHTSVAAYGLSQDLLREVNAVIIGPDVTGIERRDLCRGVRDRTLASITVISKQLDEVDELRLIVDGVCSICVLPIRPRVVAAQLVNRINRQVSNEPSTVLNFRGLDIHLNEHRVTVDGRPVQLTKMEFDLLAYLMRNPRRVYTHDELSRWLWDDSWIADHHRLEAHVCRLRKKVSRAGGPPIIGSVRGVGYRLITSTSLARTQPCGV